MSSLEAIIAPLKPINKVKWDTSVCEAGIFVNVVIKGLIISLISKSENGSVTSKIKTQQAK